MSRPLSHRVHCSVILCTSCSAVLRGGYVVRREGTPEAPEFHRWCEACELLHGGRAVGWPVAFTKPAPLRE